MSRFGALAITALLLAMAVGATALSCSDMYSSLYPCLSYFQGGGSDPSANCCSGIKSVWAKAQSTADRQAACGCLKTAAAGVSGPNIEKAAALPAKCGVSLPYKLSPSTDCSKYA